MLLFFHEQLNDGTENIDLIRLISSYTTMHGANNPSSPNNCKISWDLDADANPNY